MTTTRYWLTAATRPARAAPSSGEMALKLRALGYHILELRAGDEIGAALGREAWEAVHCSPGCRERDHRNLKAPKPIRKATISVADGWVLPSELAAVNQSRHDGGAPSHRTTSTSGRQNPLLIYGLLGDMRLCAYN